MENFIIWLGSQIKMTAKPFQNSKVSEVVWPLECPWWLLPQSLHLQNQPLGQWQSAMASSSGYDSSALPHSPAFSPGHGLPSEYSTANQDQELGSELSTNCSFSRTYWLPLFRSDRSWKLSEKKKNESLCGSYLPIETSYLCVNIKGEGMAQCPPNLSASGRVHIPFLI